MPVSQQELGQRLQVAREACRMTQEEVAQHLGLSRSGVAQMELGNRAITSLELERLAYWFGRDMWEFFGEEFHGEAALVTLFRAHPDVAGQTDVVDMLRRCLALGREVSNLERLLWIDWYLGVIAAHHFGVSLPSALYRLHDVGFMMEEELERLKVQQNVGRGNELAVPLDLLSEPDHEAIQHALRYRVLSLALDAIQQGAITRSKLQELAQMVDLGPEPLARLLCDMGLDDREEEGDVLVPEA
jgi:transcriptional regulator with XRE-family HTH domain